MNASDKQLTYNSRESAYLSLLTSEVRTGHLYLKRYLNEEGKLDILMAYGVQDCTTGYPDSIDSLKIISGNSPFPVYNIVFHNPDVSELARGQVFLYVNMRDPVTMDCEVQLVTIEKDEEGIYKKYYTEFSESTKKVYSLTQGEFYYVSSNSFRSAENFYTREEISGTINNLMDNEIRPDLVELQQAVFPLSMNFTISPTIAEKGKTVDATINYSIIRKNSNITDDCRLELKQSESIIDIPSDNIIRGVSETGNRFNLFAEYKPGFNISKEAYITFVNRSYWGVISREELQPVIDNPNLFRTIINDLQNDLRTKGTFTYSGINLDLSDTVIYAYPSSYGSLSSIKDANGFEYLQDYNIISTQLEGVNYNLYIKITPTVIVGFKQIYSF